MLIILFGHFVYQFIKEIFTVPKINIIKPTEISANAPLPHPHPQPQPPMQTMQTVPIPSNLTASNDEAELQQHMNHLINNSNSINNTNSNNMQDELNNYIKNKIKAN